MGALLFLKFHQNRMERFGYNDEGQEFPGIILAKPFVEISSPLVSI